MNTKLEMLSVPHNRLTALPAYIHVFKKLQVLELQHNRIEGEFPSTFSALTELRKVNLNAQCDDNGDCYLLKGSLGTGLMDLKYIQTFEVMDNWALTGDLHYVVPSWKDTIEYISIMYTAITGYIAGLCSDVVYCYKFMFDTHGDMTWATEGGVPDIINQTLQLALAKEDSRRLAAAP